MAKRDYQWYISPTPPVMLLHWRGFPAGASGDAQVDIRGKLQPVKIDKAALCASVGSASTTNARKIHFSVTSPREGIFNLERLRIL